MLIRIHDLVAKYGLNISGILHIGAHMCEELGDYLQMGVAEDQIIWIEANESIATQAQSAHPKAKIYNLTVSDCDGKNVELIITNNGQSSSILELDYHKIAHPHVIEVARQKKVTMTVDTFLSENKISCGNFVNIDIQGAELLALKGMTKTLAGVDYLYLEVNTKHLYKDCALLDEIDTYLAGYGFTRVEIKMTEHSWGDAFYVKSNIAPIMRDYKLTASQVMTYPGSCRELKLASDKAVCLVLTDSPTPGILQAISGHLYEMETIYPLCYVSVEAENYLLMNGWVRDRLVFRKDSITTPTYVNNCDASTNGELAFYDRICGVNPITVFDVGVREDTYYYRPQIQLHLFEPVPEFCNVLRQKLKSATNVTINAVGLGQVKGTLTYYNRSQSIIKRTICGDTDENVRQISLITLDEYCQEHKVTSIDFLKIDTEGYELNVLKGATNMLPHIQIIQFEYGGTYPDAGIKLSDVYAHLQPYGFKYFYILGRGGKISAQPHPVEHCQYSNYLAMKVPIGQI